jgi:hypothetical protein
MFLSRTDFADWACMGLFRRSLSGSWTEKNKNLMFNHIFLARPRHHSTSSHCWPLCLRLHN